MDRSDHISDGPYDPPDDVPYPVSRKTLKYFPFSMVLTDPHLNDNPIIFVNQRFTDATGYAFDAAVGRNCRFLQGEATDPEAVRRIRHAVESREELTVDLLNYRADGSSFHNRLLIAPLFDEHGDLLYFLGVQTVVRPLEGPFGKAAKLTEQLRELQHRVKNHLAMVLGMLRVETRSRPSEEVIEVLAQRLEAISLLYDSLSDTGDGSSDMVDLGAYLSRVASALQLIDSRPGVLVNVDVESAPANVDLAAHVGLYLSEVMTNALQHGLAGRDQGQIRVSLANEGARAVLTVTDDGPGMGEADWPNGGSIGSRVVRDIAARTDADLSIETDGGTVITLSIPLDA